MDELAQRLDAGVASGALAKLHAVVLLRQGETLLERYWPGEDDRWGESLDRVDFGPETLHDLRSITKSVLGLLYGIALERGLVPPPATPLLAALPEHRDLADDPRRERMLVEHALTMTLGNRWEEGSDYSDPRNPEHAMELSADRVRFVLEQPMQREPGTRWQYSGGATALLGALLVRGTGRELLPFACEALLNPLGIEVADWVATPLGQVPASGLRLRPRDLAKLGSMLLQDGRWQGRQLVPVEWLRQAFTPHIDAEDGFFGYGYQWWLSAPRPPVDWMAGFGNGGQRLTLFPRSGTVLLVMAGRYDDAEAWRLPYAVLMEYVLPALAKAR